MNPGDYEFQREPRGIRFWRPSVHGGAVRPLLHFSLALPGGNVAPFHIERVNPSPEGGVDFFGYYTDKVTIDGNILYQPDVDGFDVTAQIMNASHDMTLRLSALLELTNEADPRWMIPGLFYRENRPAGSMRMYPAFHEFNRDPKKFMSSYWSFRADRSALPVAMGWTYGCFAFFATSEVFGVSPAHPDGAGMASLHFSQDDGNPRLGGEFPYREAPVKYSFCQEDGTEPDETFVFLPKKTPLLITFTAGMKMPDLHGYHGVVRALYNRNQRFHAVRARMPHEEAERHAHMGLLRWHFDPNHSVLHETAAFDKHFGKRGTHFDRMHMHTGWQSGAMCGYTLLWGGREAQHPASVEAGSAVIDKITSELSPAGTIFPVWTEEFGWSSSFGPEEGTAHARTVAEATLFVIRATRLELEFNQVHQNWLEAAAATLNYAMAAQRPDGAFPSYFDLSTGRPTSFDGFSGVAWIAAVVAGSALLYRPHMREVAVSAGEYYMAMLQDEFLCGCIEDQPMVPSSDDAHWALISFMALYELDHDAKWLAMARKAADLAMTWRFAYNTQFAKDSLLGRLDMRTRGGDIMSVATPVTTCSGLLCYGELLKLAAITGDRYYKDRAEDSRLFATQLVAREEADLNARVGMTACQLSHTDWVEPKGKLQPLSGAYAGALIRYAELIRRKLEQPLADFVRHEFTQMTEELAAEPVLYTESVLTHGSPTAASSPSLPDFTTFSKFTDAPIAGAAALTAPTPLPIPSSFDGSERTPRPLAGPTPRPVSGPTPLPSSPTPTGARDAKPAAEDVEIKYKIF